MKPAILLRKKLASDKPVLGLLATFHFWPGLVELTIDAGLDYLIIDMEHLTHDAEAVALGCAIARRADFPVLIRPPSAEITPVRLALDLGPCGLMVPYVEDVATMNEVQQAVYMKPRGRRRPGGLGNFWVTDYNYETWKTVVEDNLFIMPQIESQIGLKNAAAIVSHPLTTAIALGPYDLATDLGVCWQPKNPILIDAMEHVRRTGAAAGKKAWAVGDAADLHKRGFTFICLGEAVMAMQGSIKSLADQARKL